MSNGTYKNLIEVIIVNSRELDDGDDSWEDYIIELCGLDPDDYYEDKSILTMQILEFNLDKILERFDYLQSTINNKEIAYRGTGMFGEHVYDWHIYSIEALEIAYQILALLILETGTYMPDKVRDEVLRITEWEYDKKWGWKHKFVEDRKKFLEIFRSAIKNHQPGKKWDTSLW
jgi:hypothetical protein